MVNKKRDFTEFEIHAVDPLADEYNRMLEAHGVRPVVKTEKLEGERLTDKYDYDLFDICCARNAIDYACSPLRVIAEIVKVTKPLGCIILQHGVNEGSRNGWAGLHNWDFFLKDRSLFLKGQSTPEVNVTELFRDFIEPVSVAAENTAVFRKKQTQKITSDCDGRFSSLLNLKDFFRRARDYVILKLSEHFPNYFDYSDIDVLCRNRDDFLAHLLEAGKIYQVKGFQIKVAAEGKNVHVDFYPQNTQRLNFRFDLLDSLSCESFHIDPEYSHIIMDTA